jgi:hypothetical protein
VLCRGEQAISIPWTAALQNSSLHFPPPSPYPLSHTRPSLFRPLKMLIFLPPGSVIICGFQIRHKKAKIMKNIYLNSIVTVIFENWYECVYGRLYKQKMYKVIFCRHLESHRIRVSIVIVVRVRVSGSVSNGTDPKHWFSAALFFHTNLLFPYLSLVTYRIKGP